jgi:hypothetical protein
MLRRSIPFSLIFATFLAAPAYPQEQAKWFVLRNHEVGNCWTAVLIRIDGEHTNTFEQKAGGPYDTEQQALERLKFLQTAQACES